MGGCKLRSEAITIFDILYLFGQGNLFLSGKSKGILKSDVDGNHEN